MKSKKNIKNIKNIKKIKKVSLKKNKKINGGDGNFLNTLKFWKRKTPSSSPITVLNNTEFGKDSSSPKTVLNNNESFLEVDTMLFKIVNYILNCLNNQHFKETRNEKSLSYIPENKRGTYNSQLTAFKTKILNLDNFIQILGYYQELSLRELWNKLKKNTKIINQINEHDEKKECTISFLDNGLIFCSLKYLLIILITHQIKLNDSDKTEPFFSKNKESPFYFMHLLVKNHYPKYCLYYESHNIKGRPRLKEFNYNANKYNEREYKPLKSYFMID